jgi:putative zinc finger/helix-turn-helix YgiT family protein
MPSKERLVNLSLQSSCPSCDGALLSETIITEKVAWDEDGTFFEVDVPVIGCDECGFKFTDSRAEKLRHDAACKFEGLLIPAEIAGIRSALGMTRAQFDAAFGIPPASMERWENSRLIQSRSMDSLLRALRNPATAARLDRRNRRHSKPQPNNVIKFPTLAEANRLGEVTILAEDFDLRVAV